MKNQKNNLNDLYIFATKPGEDQSYIKILYGDLAGAVVKINYVNIPLKPDKNGKYKVSIDYNFIETPKHNKPNKETIDKVLGEIVSDIFANYPESII